jgi:hypothetical protein
MHNFFVEKRSSTFELRTYFLHTKLSKVSNHFNGEKFAESGRPVEATSPNQAQVKLGAGQTPQNETERNFFSLPASQLRGQFTESPFLERPGANPATIEFTATTPASL